MDTMRSASGYGSGRSSTALTTEKTAMFAASASVSTAPTPSAKPLFFVRLRMA
jgi:hypothetical protein